MKPRSEVDDLGFITYNVRGIQENNGEWSYGALTKDQIDSLNTPFLVASLKLYSDFAAFKILPHGKGTMDERSTVLSIIKILKEEEASFNAWEFEKGNRNKGG